MKYDVIIVGAGMAGLSIALGLARSNFRVALIESKRITKLSNRYHKEFNRVSAINLNSCNLLEDLDIYHKIANDPDVSKYIAIDIWDQNSNAQLKFQAAEFSLLALGTIIKNDLIINQLYKELLRFNVPIFENLEILSIAQDKKQNIIKLKNCQTIIADLIVGADGKNSFIRQQYGFRCISKPCNQYAIVFNVKTEKSHQNIAYQRFLKNGVLALLPLHNLYACSVVYSIDKIDFLDVNAMNDNTFSEHVSILSELRLGALELESERTHFELTENHVNTYYKHGVVLIADAAHSIHPLAGQGINLGFSDVRTLIQVLSISRALKRDISCVSTLSKYAQRQYLSNQIMMSSIQNIRYLFCNNNLFLKALRNLGADIINRSYLLRQFFIETAS